jgi:tetratricopeptide (TPR) repeat protein
MKSTWLPWIVALLEGTASASERMPPASPRDGTTNTRLTAPAMNPQSTSASMSIDPFAPFRVKDHQSIPPQPEMLRNGMQIAGSSSGPVNTQEPDCDFFTDPRFDREPNSGRLFYHQFFLRNPHDPDIPERRAWFICWSPLDDGHRVQRLPEFPGFLISEVTSDGQSIRIEHSAESGSESRVDTLRWNGDALGRGRFEREDSTTPITQLRDPTPFEAERDRGYGLLSARKPREAIAAFERALAMQDNDPAVLFALGVVWSAIGQTNPDAESKAIHAFSRALAADPSRRAAHQHRAELHPRRGEWAKAIADLNRIIELDPEDWEPHLDRARLHAKASDLMKAIEDTREAARKAPTETAPLESMARFQYRSGQLAEAIATGHRLLTLDDSQTSVRVTMACAHAQQGQAAEALSMYADARANGVSTRERRWGIRELETWLRNAPTDAAGLAAVRRLLEPLRGTDQLEAAESGTD